MRITFTVPERIGDVVFPEDVAKKLVGHPVKERGRTIGRIVEVEGRKAIAEITDTAAAERVRGLLIPPTWSISCDPGRSR